jgi:hypothetical protein
MLMGCIHWAVLCGLWARVIAADPKSIPATEKGWHLALESNFENADFEYHSDWWQVDRNILPTNLQESCWYFQATSPKLTGNKLTSAFYSISLDKVRVVINGEKATSVWQNSAKNSECA